MGCQYAVLQGSRHDSRGVLSQVLLQPQLRVSVVKLWSPDAGSLAEVGLWQSLRGNFDAGRQWFGELDWVGATKNHNDVEELCKVNQIWISSPLMIRNSRCNCLSQMVKFDKDIWHLSFAKFLEYLGNSCFTTDTIYPVTNQSQCSHCFFHEKLYFFAMENLVTTFKVIAVSISHKKQKVSLFISDPSVQCCLLANHLQCESPESEQEGAGGWC